MRNTLQRALTAISLTLLTLQASVGSAADLLISGTIYTANDEAPTAEGPARHEPSGGGGRLALKARGRR